MNTQNRRKFFNVLMGLPLVASVPTLEDAKMDVEGHLHLEGTEYALGMKDFRNLPASEKPFIAKMYGTSITETILQHFGLR